MLNNPDRSLNPEEVPGRISLLNEHVEEACSKAYRARGDVQVELAVKYQTPAKVLAALNAGSHLLGHNIIQQLEASEKALAELSAPAHRTHVIGHVQRNKLRRAMEYAQCIETVDSIELAKKIDVIAQQMGFATYDVMLQVNSSDAPTQFGIAPKELPALAENIASLEHVRIIGLMTIGAHSTDEREIARSFALTRRLAEDLRERGHQHVRELSMGMTGDMAIAIAEGSTIVRIGTAVFGPREV